MARGLPENHRPSPTLSLGLTLPDGVFEASYAFQEVHVFIQGLLEGKMASTVSTLLVGPATVC